MKDLTEDFVLNEFRTGWGYLALTGDKEKPDSMKKYKHKCVLCQYVCNKTGVVEQENCEQYCLVEWPGGRCALQAGEGLYNKWKNASNTDERKKYARQIATLPEKHQRADTLWKDSNEELVNRIKPKEIWYSVKDIELRIDSLKFSMVSPYFDVKSLPLVSEDFSVIGPTFKQKREDNMKEEKISLKEAVDFTRKLFIRLAETGSDAKHSPNLLITGKYLNDCALCEWVKQHHDVKIGGTFGGVMFPCGKVCPFDWTDGHCACTSGEYNVWEKADTTEDRKRAALKVAMVPIKDEYLNEYLGIEETIPMCDIEPGSYAVIAEDCNHTYGGTIVKRHSGSSNTSSQYAGINSENNDWQGEITLKVKPLNKKEALRMAWESVKDED